MLQTPAAPPKPSSSAQTLKALRKIHLYFGLFIAPALLFFAFTGAVQTLSLHESAGTSYTPPTWLARLGQLHKDQNIVPRKPRAPKPESAPNTPRPEGSPNAIRPSLPAVQPAPPSARPPVTLASKEREHLPEKLFFLAVALGLLSSTLTGIYMAYKYERNRLLVTALLLAGIILPLILLPF